MTCKYMFVVECLASLYMLNFTSVKLPFNAQTVLLPFMKTVNRPLVRHYHCQVSLVSPCLCVFGCHGNSLFILTAKLGKSKRCGNVPHFK